MIRIRSAILTSLLLVSMALSVHAQNTAKQRSEIPEQYRWNTGSIYPTDAAWDADFERLKGMIELVAPFKGTLGSSADRLYDCLALRDTLNFLSSQLYIYAALVQDEDNRISSNQERTGRIAGLSAQLGEALSFVEPEILGLDSEKLRGFVGTHAKLKLYAFELEDMIRRKAHVLSPQEERILALAGPVSSAANDIFGMVTTADFDFGTIVDENGDSLKLSNERYYALLESSDRRVRRDANVSFNESYLDNENVLAATLGASVKQDWFYTQARGYKTCLEMSLDADNIPTSVFHNLIDAVNANLEPLHRWAALRKRVQKLDTLYNYDMNVPLLPDQKRDYPYEDAKKIVLAGLKPMGKKYLSEFEKGLNNRWIDVHETEGKGTGAYQWGTYTSHPFVLLNYNNTLDAVFTLAHEMGHAMHSLHINRTEPYHYSDYSLFLAEVASTCNEAVLMKHMLQNAKEKRERMALLNHYIEQIIGTFYTQVMFSEFELVIHDRIEKGDAISAEFLRDAYRKIYTKYWGSDVTIIEQADVTGMRIPHFYRMYYVYQYATCYAAAQMLSQKILDEGEKFLPTYTKFISTGSSKYPVDVLKAAGVDMTTPEPINRTISLFAELVAQMERLMMEG